MNYRTHKFLAQTGNLITGTLVHDINMIDPISNIQIELLVYNPGVVPLNHPSAVLIKIELIDGSDVLYSLTGLQAFALDWYNNGGRFRNNWNAYMNANWMTCNFALHFGRYLWDPEYAFDPSKFDNPQLRITYNCALGGNTSDKIKMTLFANLFDEKVPSLRGFLMTKEIKQYTEAAGHEYTDMPLDYPYRAIYFQPRLLGTDPYNCVTNFKLSEDQDKRIPFDMSLYNIVANLQSQYPLVHEYINLIAPVGAGVGRTAVGFTGNGIVSQYQGAASDAQCAVSSFDGGAFVIDADNATVNAVVHAVGMCPNTVVEIPCGRLDIPEDWYDVRRLGSLKSDITGVGAGADCHLSIQQGREY